MVCDRSSWQNLGLNKKMKENSEVRISRRCDGMYERLKANSSKEAYEELNLGWDDSL
jgi:hypothetical protein